MEAQQHTGTAAAVSSPTMATESIGPTARTCRGFWGLYEEWQAFGGREEGGWWYDAGRLLAMVPGERTRVDFHCWDWPTWTMIPGRPAIVGELVRQFGEALDLFEGTDHHTTRGESRLAVRWFDADEDGEPPPHYPESRPRYE